MIAHELLHLLGVGHEHQRPDRDDYVEIKWENIQNGLSYNFFRDIWERDLFSAPQLCFGQRNGNYDDCVSGLVRDDFGEGYDYDSIMHYEHF